MKLVTFKPHQRIMSIDQTSVSFSKLNHTPHLISTSNVLHRFNLRVGVNLSISLTFPSSPTSDRLQNQTSPSNQPESVNSNSLTSHIHLIINSIHHQIKPSLHLPPSPTAIHAINSTRLAGQRHITKSPSDHSRTLVFET